MYRMAAGKAWQQSDKFSFFRLCWNCKLWKHDALGSALLTLPIFLHTQIYPSLSLSFHTHTHTQPSHTYLGLSSAKTTKIYKNWVGNDFPEFVFQCGAFSCNFYTASCMRFKFGGFCRLFFAYFGVSLILKGFNIGQTF